MKSGALTVEELPPTSYKDTVDVEAAQIGLESKYQDIPVEEDDVH